jgi:hypothetical protein
MLKKSLVIGALALFTLTSTVFAASAGAASPSADVPPVPATSFVAAYPLTNEEALGLQFMREEEKLAHDVYVALYERWSLPIFETIAASEQKHTDAVVYLLDRYGLADPAAGNAPGKFTDPDLQALYDRLIVQGSTSAEGALKVGAAIEEIDIFDLQERLAATENTDIQRVYENLMAGSENHLRAFTRNLKMQIGDTYVPQYLTQKAYDAIVNAAGGGFGGRGGGRST